MNAELDRIHNGDCLQGLSRLDAESVQLAFADPPFNIGYDYDVYDDRRAANEYLEWSRRWIEGVVRVLRPDGTFWLAIGDEYAAELKVLCTRDLGLHCRNWVIWFYTFGVHCTHKFTRSHAHLFYFVKDAKRFTFNSLAARVPSARQLVYADKRAVPDGRVPDDTWMTTPELPPGTPMWDGFVLRPQDIPERFPPDSDTWYFSRVAGTFSERRGWHGCQMPEQLLGRIIRACSNEGDVVLDPFGGSGTTLAVAKKLKRQYVGFELSSEYANKIEQRLAGIEPGDPLIGPKNPELSAPRTAIGRGKTQRDSLISRRKSLGAIVVRTPLARRRTFTAEADKAITRAFVASHQGYSADRVVADPELNEAFLEKCERLAILGQPADWNRLLLNLRKRGGLESVATSRRTRVSFAMMSEYIYASEIAWRILTDRDGSSLDDILTDPARVKLFDRIAQRIAPGRSPFEYRWGALALRKVVAKGNGILSTVRGRLNRKLSLDARHLLPAEPAHYLITIGDTRLFVGFTENLNACLFFDPARIENAAAELAVRDFSLGQVSLAYQVFEPGARQPIAFSSARRARLVHELHPVGNVQPERAA
jgi:site-specific DNA-methyltransferase (adenine-specific)